MTTNKLNEVCSIYLLRNKINNKVYIGQTWQLPKYRFGTNGRGYVECTHLHNAIQKYGWDNFEHTILGTALSQEEADKKEDDFINFYNSRDTKLGYNIKSGGSRGKLSDETKRKLSILNSGENNHFFGKTHTEEVKTKISVNTTINHKNGAYVNKNEEQKRFSDEEERKIISIYSNGNISIEKLLEMFDFSYSVFEKMREKYDIETIKQPKTEEHLEKLRENAKIAKPFALKKFEENTRFLTEKVVALRKEGLLQKEISKILEITQGRVSQLLIKAGLRTEIKPPRNKVSS
jgi:group I intron endonuclease